MKNRFLCMVLVALCALFLSTEWSSPCLATEDAGSGLPALKVAFYPLDGFFEYDARGNETGYGVELLDKLSQYTGMSFTYVAADSWESTRNMLAEGKADIRMPVSMPLVPALTSGMSSCAILNTYHALMTLRSKQGLYYCDYGAFGALRVAVSAELLSRDVISSRLSEFGIREDQLLVCDDYGEARAMLDSGTADAVISNVMDLTDDMKVLARFDNTTNHICMRQDDPALLLLDSAMGRLQMNDPLFLPDLYKKWFPERVCVPLTRAEVEYVAGIGHLRFAFAENEGYLSRLEDGVFKGFFPSLAELLCERLGVEYEAVSRNASTSGTYEEPLIFPGYSNDLLHAAKNGVSVTDPFFTANYCWVQQEDADVNSADCTVAVVDGPDSPARFLLKDFSSEQLLYFEDWGACIRAVSFGKADVTILNNYIADYYLSVYHHGNLISVFTDNYSHGVSFGVTQRNSVLSSIISKTLGSVSAEEIDQLIIRAQTDKPQHSGPLDLFRSHPTQTLSVLAALACLLGTMVVLAAFIRRISRQNLALQSANTAKTDFLSRMSHDMRTPMNGILGMTALTMDLPDLSQEARANLSAIRDSSNYLLSLINDTLDMSRIEGQKIELHKEPVLASELIEHTLSGIYPSAQFKAIQISTKFVGFQNEYILADRVRMRQIFTNLLSNAVKFTQEHGKIEIHFECMKQQHGISLSRITVSDNGVGMSEEFQKHAFEPFSQEPNSQSNRYAGSGLGLPIVQNLVHLMGGTISIRSKLSEGTSITVDLPIEVLEHYQPPPPGETSMFLELRGKRVLLCEDHPLNATIAKKLLTKMGVLVEWAEDGQQGVDLFMQRDWDYYDAILMDIRMPVMDGLSAARVIRNLRRGDAKTVPIIAMTANAFDFDVKASFSAGMDHHLDKPVEPEKLYRVLAEQICLRSGGKSKRR
ncbi:ATP-binding protein [Oscillibacter sp.]|uniref:ATP-binding protein n=1 Tax=Oscillibacter sp. TaxID=1945593 RepID=UPI0028A93821|nr:ATP-binding protein [Oscillibacter sp.]